MDDGYDAGNPVPGAGTPNGLDVFCYLHSWPQDCQAAGSEVGPLWASSTQSSRSWINGRTRWQRKGLTCWAK
jgi:hypothetical protein